MVLREDVEHGGTRDFVGPVETHAMEHACAAIVTGTVEAIKSKFRHDLDLVLRHGAKRIAAVVIAARRLLRIAIATQIRADNAKFIGQTRGDLVPGEMREWIAVQQK